jgi:hypothetical protein
MSQAYEQGDQDIMNAEARAFFALARMLRCSGEVIGSETVMRFGNRRGASPQRGKPKIILQEFN